MQTALTASDADALIERYIQPDPDGFGLDRARVVVGDAAVPVWALVGHLRGSSQRQTASDYALPAEAVVAAIAYYRRHQAVIDARLTLNDAFFEP
ncbi:MAG: DUF433 domain-containing protein [Thermomicrobiales bacterium]